MYIYSSLVGEKCSKFEFRLSANFHVYSETFAHCIILSSDKNKYKYIHI